MSARQIINRTLLRLLLSNETLMLNSKRAWDAIHVCIFEDLCVCVNDVSILALPASQIVSIFVHLIVCTHISFLFFFVLVPPFLSQAVHSLTHGLLLSCFP